MEHYSIGYSDLMEFPFEKYIEFSQIISEESKEEKKQEKRKKDEMERSM